ncbi:MAG: cupin domain-containing protein [Campylobacterota bacterium]|nr:cupin domain-containing protein [Campylobacterota bacterium]
MINNRLVANEALAIKQIMQLIDNNKSGFIIAIDDDYFFKGIVTDGDIRRAILNDISIISDINVLIKSNYDFVMKDASFFEVSEKFKSSRINVLPILDTNMKLINILTKKQFHIMLLEDIEFDLSYDFTKLNHITLDHEIYSRPWGFYKSTILSSHAQAKTITVFPNSELSLQEHKKREEHWVIIKGNGKVVLGESIIDVYPGKYIYIPKGCKHQMINDSDENIVFSEVQLGDYFGEDDIIRYSDKYGRK